MKRCPYTIRLDEVTDFQLWLTAKVGTWSWPPACSHLTLTLLPLCDPDFFHVAVNSRETHPTGYFLIKSGLIFYPRYRSGFMTSKCHLWEQRPLRRARALQDTLQRNKRRTAATVATATVPGGTTLEEHLDKQNKQHHQLNTQSSASTAWRRTMHRKHSHLSMTAYNFCGISGHVTSNGSHCSPL